MPDHLEELFEKHVINLIKSEMGRRLVKCNDLAEKLSLNPNSLRNKINRGTFSAAFFLKILHVLGTKELVIPTEIKEDYDFINDF